MSAGKGIVLAVTLAAVAAAQTSARPAFEVASIRASAISETIQQGKVAIGVHIDRAQVRVTGFTLKEYLGIAYRLKVAQISGPEWIASDRFDTWATIPAGASASRIGGMFQSLLAERFQLKFHREKKEFPVYALVEGRGPLKLKEERPDPGDAATPLPLVVTGSGAANGVNINYGNGSTFTFVPNTVEVHKLSMEQFAGIIERFADRTVVDIAGLKRQYGFKVDISADDYLPMLIHSAINSGVVLQPEAAKLAEGNTATGLSDALQQVGLKLDARKASLDVIVVDDARRTPTEN